MNFFSNIIAFFEGKAADPATTPATASAQANAATGLRGIAQQIEAAVAPLADTIVDEFTAKLPLGTMWDPILDNVLASAFNKLLDQIPATSAATVATAVAAAHGPAPQVTMQPIP